MKSAPQIRLEMHFLQTPAESGKIIQGLMVTDKSG